MCLGKGVVAFWIETVELNCPERMGGSLGWPDGAHVAVVTGAHPCREIERR